MRNNKLLNLNKRFLNPLNEQNQAEEPKSDKAIEESPKDLNVEESSNNPKPKENRPEVIELDPVNKPTLKPKLPEREGVLPPK